MLFVENTTHFERQLNITNEESSNRAKQPSIFDRFKPKEKEEQPTEIIERPQPVENKQKKQENVKK